MLEVISDPPPMNSLHSFFCFLSSINYVITKIFERKELPEMYICVYITESLGHLHYVGKLPGNPDYRRKVHGVGNIQKNHHSLIK
jgi:hypothetical protein